MNTYWTSILKNLICWCTGLVWAKGAFLIGLQRPRARVILYFRVLLKVSPWSRERRAVMRTPCPPQAGSSVYLSLLWFMADNVWESCFGPHSWYTQATGCCLQMEHGMNCPLPETGGGRHGLYSHVFIITCVVCIHILFVIQLIFIYLSFGSEAQCRKPGEF